MPPQLKTFAALFILFALLTALIVGGLFLQNGNNVYESDPRNLATPADCPSDFSFAIIGDYGTGDQTEADVARLVNSWQPRFILTTGDNNYPDGEAETIDFNIGQYFADYITPYNGNYPSTASENAFFPALGNHDLRTNNGQPYFDYFELPGNERYYDFVQGPVHFFVINSDRSEADGRSPDSAQAQWLQTRMSQSDSPWKIILMHHTPYTSALRRRTAEELQWPYAKWGATAVISGHNHFYERLEVDGLPYIINGSGGRRLYKFGPAQAENKARYNVDYGAMRVLATEDCLNFSFYNRSQDLIDSLTLLKNN